MRFPLQSIESSEFNEVVQIDHQKICMTDSGYNQVLVTKYAEAETSDSMFQPFRLNFSTLSEFSWSFPKKDHSLISSVSSV